jgi:hypothetical protein
LISLNRFPATRMLPAADLHNDIHEGTSASGSAARRDSCSVRQARLSL